MNKQSGFTLIELVVVIIILGILAATAVPKFVDLQSDARVSALKGLKGALEGAATLTYARAAIDGEVDGDGDVDGVTTVYGYPAATKDDLEEAAGLSEVDWLITEETGYVFITPKNSSADFCGVTYKASTSEGARPDIYLGKNTSASDDDADENFGC